MSDALVVGGGLAGASVATLLARAGCSVQLVERSIAAHDKVCGEFLSREAISYLAALGLDLSTLGAVPIRGVRLARKEMIAEAQLPFPALSLTRRTLDEALLRHAEASGVQVYRGRRVDTVAPRSVTLQDAAQLHADDIFLATGKHDVNKLARPSGIQNDLVAFKMYFRLSPEQHAALGANVELILYPGGYAGLQPVENDAVNLCLLVQRSRIIPWIDLLASLRALSPHLASRLAGSQPLLAKPLALSSIPYGMLLSQSSDSLWRLGDQAAVIPSFSGDGMSIALHSAHLAAQHYFSGSSPGSYHRELHGELHRSLSLATTLSRIFVNTPVLTNLTRIWPSLLRTFATSTRIPSKALRLPSYAAPASIHF